MKIDILIVAGLVLLLSSCSSSANSSSAKSRITTSATSMQSSSSELIDEYTSITVDVVSYKDNILKCKTDDKEFTFTTSDSTFEINGEDFSNLSTAIIANSFDIKVSADIVYDDVSDELKSCDVISPNGKIFSYSEGYYFDSCLMNIAEFHNENSSYNVDLGGLDKNYLSDFQSENQEDFGLGGFIFSDSNNIVADEVLPFEYEDDYGRHYGNEPQQIYKYYGIVNKVENQKVSVLLNNNVEVKLTPSIICGFDKINIGDEICASFTQQKDFLKRQDKTSFDWAVIYSASDLDCNVTVTSKDNIHAECNGENVIIEGQYDVNYSDNITVSFPDINYSYFDDTYEVYNVKKVEVEQE